MSDKATLLEFGFSEIRAEKALKATNNSGLQQALDWLDAHANDADIDDPLTETTEPPSDIPPTDPTSSDTSTALSLVCNECGKQFANMDLAQYHGTKSGHSDFSESTSAVKPLSEEEKKQKLDALQKRIAEKRKQREEMEKQEQRKNELIRRKAGQDMAENQERMKEEQMKKEVERQKREKEDDKRAAKKIKEQIEQDKRDRAARLAKEKAEREGSSAVETTNVPLVSMLQAGVPQVVATGNQARLQIRPMLQSDKQVAPLTKVFEATQTLKDVRAFIKASIPDLGHHFKLSLSFPRKDFGSHDDSKTLKDLGLAPSAALILTE
ncbi:hypothetical protein H4R99_000569 [Coemansia sp. RSA 1722]|nr:hypothetical protein LPJ57_000261 [Coemansia sp. RSA 486]KAJ2238069.1 hypothetical protein IWW45_000409 [Coemansia sp. RSA 485]KAJ2603572.1 hypothetical protein GGF39_000065 [Coemansia sp. RSA 1721]KAJ2606174.1 hypothetical protein H4R99_000569 [Coemansia sp. RSA 1722]KAJ2639703.1 hypothetical protein GGF40_000669 [Coemansia sp. RSA 1286]